MKDKNEKTRGQEIREKEELLEKEGMTTEVIEEYERKVISGIIEKEGIRKKGRGNMGEKDEKKTSK